PTMNPRTRLLFRGLIGLALVWGVVLAVAKIAGSARATPEKIIAFADANSLEDIEDPAERRRVIGRIADMLNQLSPAEMNALAERHGEDPRRNYLESMTPEEQMFFLEKRVGRAFEQMMQAFNEMDREERKRLVEQSLKQMRDDPNRGDPSRLEEADPEVVEKITQAGLKAYYSEASAETKIDLAPLMEEMQRTLSRTGGRAR